MSPKEFLSRDLGIGSGEFYYYIYPHFPTIFYYRRYITSESFTQISIGSFFLLKAE